jgi:hypothetical protein
MPEPANINEATPYLSRPTDRAAAAEGIVIPHSRKPILPAQDAQPRQPGLPTGLKVPDALFAPLPDDQQTLWE